MEPPQKKITRLLVASGTCASGKPKQAFLPNHQSVQSLSRV